MSSTRGPRPVATFVVLSDIHANAHAFRRALELARQGPMDQLVILGDLLTYGFDIDAVLELTASAQSRDDAWLFLGNHDQLYLDLAAGKTDYYAKLPEWIRESADHTIGHLDVAAFRDGLAWQKEHIVEELLFAHANPFGYGDWRYLNSLEDHRDAANRLEARGLRGGVFGHTHRAKAFVHREGVTDELGAQGTMVVDLTSRAALVLNPGSVGQPREASGFSTFARIRWDGLAASVEVVRFEYDVAAHLRSIDGSLLSDATKRRLASFFVQP